MFVCSNMAFLGAVAGQLADVPHLLVCPCDLLFPSLPVFLERPEPLSCICCACLFLGHAFGPKLCEGELQILGFSLAETFCVGNVSGYSK